jgi:hypothetical protein
MITVPIWQILLAMFLSGFVSFLLGVCTMAAWAMAGYDGDEARSEPE